MRKKTYVYFVSYKLQRDTNEPVCDGNCEIKQSVPITSMDDIEIIAKTIAETKKSTRFSVDPKVIINNFILLRKE